MDRRKEPSVLAAKTFMSVSYISFLANYWTQVQQRSHNSPTVGLMPCLSCNNVPCREYAVDVQAEQGLAPGMYFQCPAFEPLS